MNRPLLSKIYYYSITNYPKQETKDKVFLPCSVKIIFSVLVKERSAGVGAFSVLVRERSAGVGAFPALVKERSAGMGAFVSNFLGSFVHQKQTSRIIKHKTIYLL